MFKVLSKRNMFGDKTRSHIFWLLNILPWETLNDHDWSCLILWGEIWRKVDKHLINIVKQFCSFERRSNMLDTIFTFTLVRRHQIFLVWKGLSSNQWLWGKLPGNHIEKAMWNYTSRSTASVARHHIVKRTLCISSYYFCRISRLWWYWTRWLGLNISLPLTIRHIYKKVILWN